MKSYKTVYFVSSIISHQDTLQQFNQVVIAAGVIIKDNKLEIITKPNTIYFDLPKNLKHETWLNHKIQWICSWAYNKKRS